MKRLFLLLSVVLMSGCQIKFTESLIPQGGNGHFISEDFLVTHAVGNGFLADQGNLVYSVAGIRSAFDTSYVNSANYDIGYSPQGARTGRTNLFIVNYSGTPIRLERFDLEGDSSDFEVEFEQDFPIDLAAHSQIEFKVFFNPTQANRESSARLAIHSESNGSAYFKLLGTSKDQAILRLSSGEGGNSKYPLPNGYHVIANIPPSSFALSNVSGWHFENLPRSTRVYLRNRGSQPLTISDTRLVGDPGFSIDGDVPTRLDSNEEKMIRIRFEGQAAGNFSTKLIINSSDPRHPAYQVSIHEVSKGAQPYPIFRMTRADAATPSAPSAPAEYPQFNGSVTRPSVFHAKLHIFNIGSAPLSLPANALSFDRANSGFTANFSQEINIPAGGRFSLPVDFESNRSNSTVAIRLPNGPWASAQTTQKVITLQVEVSLQPGTVDLFVQGYDDEGDGESEEDIRVRRGSRVLLHWRTERVGSCKLFGNDDVVEEELTNTPEAGYEVGPLDQDVKYELICTALNGATLRDELEVEARMFPNLPGLGN